MSRWQKPGGSAVAKVLVPMRQGARLVLEYNKDGAETYWLAVTTGDWQRLNAVVARKVIEQPSVVPQADGLFPDAKPQSWRHVVAIATEAVAKVSA